MAFSKEKEFLEGSSDSFEEVLNGLVQGNRRGLCYVCASSNREKIEQAYTSGVPFITLVKVMQKMGEMPVNITFKTLGASISKHKEEQHGAREKVT